MRIRLVTAASVLALAACQPTGTEAPKTAEAAAPVETAAVETATVEAGCNMTVSKPWIDQETPIRRYTAEASVLGTNCSQGVAVLVIRQREGTPLYSWVGQVDYLFGLRDATDPAAMKTALREWIDQGAAGPEKTGTLPVWEETEGQPKRAEFPFMPIEGTDKAQWEQLKKDNLEMFCFPQGMESSNCAALRPGEDGAPASMEEIGIQLFPG